MTRRILFCTIGQTPQVVTETVWALKDRRPTWVPDEVHVVTTTFALPRIRGALQHPRGRLAVLFDGRLPPVTVHVPRRCGTPAVFQPIRAAGDWSDDPAAELPPVALDDDALRDVNSEQDAAVMGDLILKLMAGFVQDPDTEVHVSLAGGRKTMSAHALLAMTLIARLQDRASHVLVSPPDFEDHPEFWHPDQGGSIARKRPAGGGPAAQPPGVLDPKDAKVTLVPTPAPLMRYEVKDEEALEKLRLVDVVSRINLAAALKADPRIRLITATNTVAVGQVECKLGPKLFAMYRLIATAWKESWPGVGPYGDGHGHAGWLSVPQICIGTAPSGKRIEAILLGYIREAVVADGGDADHMSVVEWRDNVVIETNPSIKLANAQSAIGSNTRLIEALEEEFGAPAAGLIAPAVEYRRQPKLGPGEPIKVTGATRFGVHAGVPPSAFDIV
jgi:CRISPR-associated protein (TIGR02584 family)